MWQPMQPRSAMSFCPRRGVAAPRDGRDRAGCDFSKRYATIELTIVSFSIRPCTFIFCWADVGLWGPDTLTKFSW